MNFGSSVFNSVGLYAHGHDVPTSITALFAALLVGLILCLAFEEKLHAKKSIIAVCRMCGK